MFDKVEILTRTCGIIFDLDGTLVDSAGGISAAVNRMLAAEGAAPIASATVQGFIGSGLPSLVARVCRSQGIPASRHAALATRLEAEYGADPAAAGPLYPGVIAALTALARAGHPLAICTNKPLRPARAVLKATGLGAFFPVIVGGDSLPVRKPDPAPLLTAWRALGTRQAIFVGDSGTDAQTAQAAALPFVLFTEGYLNAARDRIAERASYSDFASFPGLIFRLMEESGN